jgi:hypothetical protein
MKSRILFLSVILLSFSIFQIHGLSQEAKWKGTIEEEDGIKVIKNPKEPLYGEITFELEEDLSIGNEEDDNCYFYKTVDIEVDIEGNIYVLDRANYRVQKFDKDGNYILTMGRKGQGPGEFETLGNLLIDRAGGVCVNDRQMIHIFNLNGQLEECLNLHRNFSSFSFTNSGEIVCQVSTRVAEGRAEKIALLQQDGQLLKSYISSLMPEIRIKNRIIIGGNTYNPRLYLCSWTKGAAVYGLSSEYTLYFLNSLGETAFIAQKEEKPEVISKKEKNEFFDQMLKSQRERQRRFPDSTFLSIDEIRKAYAFPQYKSFYAILLSDENGNVFVFRIPPLNRMPTETEFDLFNSEGYYLYRIKMATLPRVIRNGYAYREKWDSDNEFFRIKRYKIKNWDQIKTGFN